MPKKTAYSRSGAQRSKSRQKSVELVRPASEPEEMHTATESRVEANAAEQETVEEEVVMKQEEEAEQRVEVKEKVGKRAGSPGRSPAPAPAVPNHAPPSASARIAARRQAAQRIQRAPASQVVAENYGYVRRDLVFILILAIIMFSAIIALHFLLGS